jgi:tetratricopeptide (TPR) repeat protein
LVVYATKLITNIRAVKLVWKGFKKFNYKTMERIEKLKEFLRASPADSFLQHALALEYIKTGDDSSARILFEEILKRDPDYIGSYYHLARLLERTGDQEMAILWYEKGMAAARLAGDQHAYNELQMAYQDLV